MSSIAPDARDVPGARLGGARADFVGSLGRKVGDARELLAALEGDLSSKTARDELRRRLHALGSGARLLRFDSMARSLQEALAALDHGAQAGGLREQELVFVGRVLDDLPALAWGEAPIREAARPAEELGETASQMPIAILIVGGDGPSSANERKTSRRLSSSPARMPLISWSSTPISFTPPNSSRPSSTIR
jgi:hypothetical protein